MEISLIVAAADNGVIGTNDGRIPWRQPADQAYFRAKTMGHPMIMGRTTFETFKRPLPGRQHIVVTHDPDYQAAGCTVVHSIAEALQAAGDTDEIFIIGGGKIFEQTMSLATKIYLTRIHAQPEGEVHFDYDPAQWVEVSSEKHQADDENQYDYTFLVLASQKAKNTTNS